MELEVMELQREIARRRGNSTHMTAAIQFGAVRRTIGRGMIFAGKSIAGTTGSGA
jgi:hypothetical protein